MAVHTVRKDAAVNRAGTAQAKTAPVAQAQRPNVAQAIRFYPNLHPGANMPVDQNNIFRLNSFAGQWRLQKTNSHGAYVPNLKYNFVTTTDGALLLHNRYRHPSLASGQQVLYAGEVYFDNGKLGWWSNASGHYRPDEEDAKQAKLPMDSFYSYDEVLRGGPQRKKREG